MLQALTPQESVKRMCEGTWRGKGSRRGGVRCEDAEQVFGAVVKLSYSYWGAWVQVPSSAFKPSSLQMHSLGGSR